MPSNKGSISNLQAPCLEHTHLSFGSFAKLARFLHEPNDFEKIQKIEVIWLTWLSHEYNSSCETLTLMISKCVGLKSLRIRVAYVLPSLDHPSLELLGTLRNIELEIIKTTRWYGQQREWKERLEENSANVEKVSLSNEPC